MVLFRGPKDDFNRVVSVSGIQDGLISATGNTNVDLKPSVSKSIRIRSKERRYE